jgi:hypothetical protein
VLWIGLGLAVTQLIGHLLRLWWINEALGRPGGRGWQVDPWELLSSPMVRMLVVNLTLTVWLVVAAATGLRLRRRARVALLAYGWAALLALALSVADSAFVSFNRFSESRLYVVSEASERAQFAVYPVVLILLMRRRQVRDLFDPWAPGFALDPPREQDAPPAPAEHRP